MKQSAALGLFLFLFFLIAVPSGVVSRPSPHWEKLAVSGDSPPLGRDFHSTAVTDKNQVYFFGGNTGINGWALWNDLHVFDIGMSAPVSVLATSP